MFEIARYEPTVLLGVEVVCKDFQIKVSSDVDFIRTLVREIYSDPSYARELSLSECKR